MKTWRLLSGHWLFWKLNIFENVPLTLLTSLLTICQLPTTAQSTTQRLDSLFAALQDEQRLNGTVLVAEQGKVIYQKSFGFAQVNTKILNRDDTRFQLASIGKTFTAVAILQLYEQKKLKLDDALINYLPDFPFATITIRQLLSHTAGLPDLQIFEPYIRDNPARILTNADVIPALKKFGKLPFEPGERWSYSNPGYCLLALVVEKLTKMPFHTYLNSHVWQASSMPNTYPCSIPTAKVDPKRAESYQPIFFSSQLQLVDTMQRYHPLLVNFGGLQGLGFIASTANDLWSFDRALYSGRLLKAQTLALAFTPTRLKNGNQADVERNKVTYGLGWFIGQDTTIGKRVWHSGFIPGGSTLFLRNLTRQQTVVILTNAESDGLQESGENVLKLLTNRHLAPEKKSLAKQYVRALFEQGPDYGAARFMSMRTDTAHYRFSPAEMDYAGHQFLLNGYTSQALETLKILTFAESQAWQPYTSYAEVLQLIGKKAEAVIMYQKSLSLNATNERVRQALTQLLSEK
ncbi:serine hydrolase [Spirosoma sp. KCTC 42546]|uniref:serine hydrolase domain-containing protein n=1 Tax=Spirosoma sp. KCTC 42546 TaxID=2520506 RepID=UPI00143D3241|nr:serine hydrolase domain-containing protein [Spirosoma sp. KCTC 42546]